MCAEVSHCLSSKHSWQAKRPNTQLVGTLQQREDFEYFSISLSHEQLLTLPHGVAAVGGVLCTAKVLAAFLASPGQGQ